MRRPFTLLLLMLALVLGACGNGGDDQAADSETNGSASEADSGDHNDADVEFLQGMIPHHEQAVEMAELALEKSSRSDLKSIALAIRDAQAPEIDQMKTWLKEWGEELETSAGHGGGHGGDSGDMGMLSDDEMKELEGASGSGFDELFIAGMVRHHNGAIEMAQLELEEGQYGPAKELAQNIIRTQDAEIEELERLNDGA